MACHYLTHVSSHVKMSQAAHHHHRKLREKHLRMKVSIRVRVESPDVGSRESVSVSCSSCSNHSQEPDNIFKDLSNLYNLSSSGDQLRGYVSRQQQDFPEQV